MRKNFLTIWVWAALAALAMPAMARASENLLTFSAVNVTDMLADMRGGLARGAAIVDKADLTAAYAGDDHHMPGLSAFLDVQLTSGGDFSGAMVGNAQDVSNLDGPAGLRLANAWLAKDFDGRGGVKAGVVDLNTEFDVQPTGALFLNSAFGIGPDFSQSGRNGPSIFPNTGLGVVAWWLPGGHWQLKSGLFEGIPGDPAHRGRTEFSLSLNEGALLALEARNHLTPNFVVGAGVWRYTASFDGIEPAPGRASGNSGVYAIADGQLYAAPEGEKSGLSGWVRIGFADDRINPIAAVIGGGLVYTGPFRRMADQVGLSVTRVHIGAPARRAAQSGGALSGPVETAVEATYSLAAGSHLTVQPDLQLVISPAANPQLRDALVAGCRLTLTQ